MKKKTQFLLNLALTAIFFILIIFQGPNLNPLYPDGAFSWCFIISCYVVLNFFVALGSVRVGANEYGRPQISIDKSVRGYKRGFVLLAILWVLYFGVSILSMPLLITRPTGPVRRPGRIRIHGYGTAPCFGPASNRGQESGKRAGR